MKCGHPGNFRVDVVSKIFLLVVKVVQKLENTVFVFSPNKVWSDLKHLGTHEHGECSNPWSEL